MLPATAAFFPADHPRRTERLPRALGEHVMSQLEQPGNLDRFGNPAYRLITIILMRCGLRITDALQLRSDCVTTDADGAPYLRYFTHKMRRDALVPIETELVDLIGGTATSSAGRAAHPSCSHGPARTSMAATRSDHRPTGWRWSAGSMPWHGYSL
jgi:integrase